MEQPVELGVAADLVGDELAGDRGRMGGARARGEQRLGAKWEGKSAKWEQPVELGVAADLVEMSWRVIGEEWVVRRY